MKIEWLSSQSDSGVLTIYSNNITLNKQATDFIKDSYSVIVGISRETKELVIKSLSKEDVEKQDISKESLKKLSIKKSYSRITGKALIDELSKVFNLDFKQSSAFKFNAKWNNRYKMLIATIVNEVK